MMKNQNSHYNYHRLSARYLRKWINRQPSISEINHNLIIISLVDDGIEVVQPHEVANSLGSYFRDAPLEPIAQMGCTGKVDELGADEEFSGSFFVEEYSELKIEKIIKSKIKNKMTAGPGDIPAAIFKRSALVMLGVLTFSMNSSLSAEIFRSALRLSRIKPIHKKNDKKYAKIIAQ
ncbi:hypothetical protein HHI36_002157 [Cryptolaemus montrouzieri]|uniref:Uncharacterized protein n=1 Tax=Cryptolaemus montrouzieri TaxID=559131 RepID=A0ABD2PB17_9CUCU